MKILLMASRVPYPLHNGEDLRIFHLAKQLSSRHEIDLIAYGQHGSLADEIRHCFKEVHLLANGTETDEVQRGYKRLVDSLLPSRMYSFDVRIYALLQKLLKERSFDLIWIPAWQMMPYSYHLSGVRVLLDIMDDGVLELLREAKVSRSFKPFLINLKRLLVTYCFERKYFPRVNWCCVVTEADALFLRRMCSKANVVIVPNGVDCEYFRPLGSSEIYPSLVFEGNMSFAPSVDAICYFHSEVFPQIKNQMPETKLWIVGKDPVKAIQDLKGDDVTVTGYVQDVRPYLDRASVFVCPMRKGAGIKNKILQAWAMGKAVVSTSIASAGLCAKPGENIVVADSSDRFAAEVVRLLKDGPLRKAIGERAKHMVRDRYSWRQQAELLEATVKGN